MSLQKLLAGVGLVLTLHAPLTGQMVNQAGIGLSTNKENSFVARPTPLVTHELTAHKVKRNGDLSKARDAGRIEISPTSMYTELFLGIYKILHTQANDSVFITYQTTDFMWYHQKDIYTEIKTDSLRLTDVYTTKQENKRKELQVGKGYGSNTLPLIEAVQEVLNNENKDTITLVNMGEEYHIPFYETQQGNNIITTTDLADLIRQNTVTNIEVENPVTVYSSFEQGKKLPYYVEGKVHISNATGLTAIFNGQWVLIARKKND